MSSWNPVWPDDLCDIIEQRDKEIERLRARLHDATRRVGEWIDKVVIPNWEMIRTLHAMLNPAPVDSVTTTGQPVPAETYPQGDGKAGGDPRFIDLCQDCPKNTGEPCKTCISPTINFAVEERFGGEQ